MAASKFFYGACADLQVISRFGLCALVGGTIVTAADQAWDTNLLTTQKNFVANFIGAAVSPHASGGGAKTSFQVGREAIYDYNCASASFDVGDLVGPAKASGNALENNKVVAVATIDAAIGYVIKKATSVTTVKVQVVERKSKLAWPLASIILKDGSVAMAAALAMGTHKITGLAAPAASGDAARVDDVTTPGSATLTIGAEDGSDNIALTVQLKDAKGANLASKREIVLWMSAADGGVEAAITDMTVTTGTLIKEETANACMRIVTDATGKAIVTLQHTGGVHADFACVRIPGGLISTLAVNFA